MFFIHTILHQIQFSSVKKPRTKKTACTTSQFQSSNPENSACTTSQIQSSNPENSAWTTSQIQHVIHSNNHIANSTKCHFHGPKQGNNQRGKIPHLLKCVGSVLDPPKSETTEEKASSSLSPFFLSFCFLFFLSFFSFFLSFLSSPLVYELFVISPQTTKLVRPRGAHLTSICLTLGQLKTKFPPCHNFNHFHAHA